jgi:hypothetical protein
MKHGMCILAAGLAFLTSGPSPGQKGGKGRGRNEFEAVKNGWIFSLAQGKAQAAKSNKPLMVVMRCVP